MLQIYRDIAVFLVAMVLDPKLWFWTSEIMVLANLKVGRSEKGNNRDNNSVEV